MQATLPDRVRLGDFEVDLRAGELRDGDRVVLLQEQPFQILSMLIARGGEIVTREEIQKKLWPNDTVVEFDHSINAAIKKLRRELGDTADAPQYIETVARRGYRLLVPVETVAAEIKPAWVWKPEKSEIRLERGTATETFHRRRATDRNEAVISHGGMIGKKVSHYRVLSVVGGGGMGMVYKAEDLKLGRQVALKFLPEEMAWDTVALQRFEREARAASSLDHPNICTIYEVEEHEEQPFIVMQLLQGETLRDLLSSMSGSGSKLGADEFLEIATQICEGLEAAHSKGIIHRDIKPANIFLTTSGTVKILDFGLAKLVKEAGSDGVQLEPGGAVPAGRPVAGDSSLTRLGSTMGTAGYMSPEQVRGEKLDARSDIFSFGLVLYEMATGQRAFSGETAAAVQGAIVKCAPVAVSEWNAEVPRGLEEIIGKALEKDRAKRYQTVAELEAELQRVTSERNSRRARVGRRWALWSAAGAVIIVLAAGLVAARFAWQRADTAPEVKEQQITANPVDDPVTGGAVSPDGKYAAYHDQTGLYLRYLDSGETRPVALPAELSGRIGSLCWIPGAGKLLADVRSSDGFDIWIITALGKEEPRLLYRHGRQAAIAPDGRSIAFLGYEPGNAQRALWVGDVTGALPRKVVDGAESEVVFAPAWSPDDQWIAYGKHWKTGGDAWSSAIEAVPAGGGAAKTLVAESSLPQTSTLILGTVDAAVFAEKWSPDGRLIFSLTEGPDSSHAKPRYSLWKVQADPHTAKVAGQPKPLTGWGDFGFANLTVTNDGKILSFVKDRSWSDVYLGQLSPNETSMSEPHRFTLDDRGSEQAVWAPDSRAILFDSRRNGKREIFRQGLDENVAAAVLSGARDVYGVALSPDGKWFIYYESGLGASDGTAASTAASSPRVDVRAYRRLMHRPVAGGSPEPLFRAPQAASAAGAFYCASNPKAAVPCVLGLQEGRQLAFYALDPVLGQGNRLGTIEVSTGSNPSWTVSSDGSRVVLVDEDQYSGRIELLNVLDGTRSEVTLDPGAGRLASAVTSADGKSFFVTTLVGGSSRLAHVTPSGKVEFLLSSGGLRQFAHRPMPSPDGNYLAFPAQTRDSNLWMIDSF